MSEFLQYCIGSSIVLVSFGIFAWFVMRGISLIMSSKKPKGSSSVPKEPANDLEARLDALQTKRFGVPMDVVPRKDNLVMGGNPRAAEHVKRIRAAQSGKG